MHYLNYKGHNLECVASNFYRKFDYLEQYPPKMTDLISLLKKDKNSTSSKYRILLKIFDISVEYTMLSRLI